MMLTDNQQVSAKDAICDLDLKIHVYIKLNILSSIDEFSSVSKSPTNSDDDELILKSPQVGKIQA